MTLAPPSPAVTAAEALARGLGPHQLRAAAAWNTAQADAANDRCRYRRRLRRQAAALTEAADALEQRIATLFGAAA